MRYIDADALLERSQAHSFCVGIRNGKSLLAACKNYLWLNVNDAPTADVVEVVRCRDCKYYDSYYTSCDHERHDHQEFRVVQEPDDYCSYGERRSE